MYVRPFGRPVQLDESSSEDLDATPSSLMILAYSFFFFESTPNLCYIFIEGKSFLICTLLELQLSFHLPNQDEQNPSLLQKQYTSDVVSFPIL
jgi:hypothetical protein